jgi:hypothetical protein
MAHQPLAGDNCFFSRKLQEAAMGGAGTLRRWVNRQNWQLKLLLLAVVLSCLLGAVLGITGLWEAWQNGRWDDSYWRDSFFQAVVLLIGGTAPSSLGLAFYFAERTQEKELETTAGAFTQQQSKSAKRRLIAASGFVPLLLVGLFAATAFGMQTYERTSYNALLAQIQTHRPLYQHAAETFPANYLYIQVSNHISFGTPAFQTPGTYSDSAVEVTVRLTSQVSSDELATESLGLLLRGYDTESGIIFQISPNGDWSIGRHPDQAKDNALTYLHHSNAIHTAPGASNRLAVIMHGDQYICFVNDQFIGIYQDSGSPTGPIGFDTEIDDASAAFTDLTIYPL